MITGKKQIETLEELLRLRKIMLNACFQDNLTYLQKVVEINIMNSEKELKELKTKITYEQLTIF